MMTFLFSALFYVTQFNNFSLITFIFIIKYLYSDVYSICVAFPDPLADKLYAETKLFLENHVKNLLTEYNGFPDSTPNNFLVLPKYFNAWKNYSQGLEYLNYLYL